MPRLLVRIRCRKGTTPFVAPRHERGIYMKTKQLTVDAMLSAMCAVLGFIAVDTGNLKVTFESLPIMLGALLFGPIDGLVIGGIGTLLYQLLRYGVSVTTPLWMLPYALCGLIVGLYAKKHDYALGKRQLTVLVVLTELLITALNTGVLCIDSLIYGYYSSIYIFGTLIPRILICVIKAVAFSFVLPVLIGAVRRGMVGKSLMGGHG